jgi:hypothetical protein
MAKKVKDDLGSNKKSKMSLQEKLAKKREDVKKGEGGNIDMFYVKEGVNRFRPAFCGEDVDFSIEVISFYLGKEIKGFVSPHTVGKPCAGMEVYNALLKSSNESDKELANECKPKRKQAIAMHKYNDDKGKELDTRSGVKLTPLANGVYGQILDFFLDEEHGDFTHPKDGYDIKIKREGSGKENTSYTATPCKPTALPKELQKEVYSPSKLLDEVIPSYEETVSKMKEFLGLDEDDDLTQFIQEISGKKSSSKKSSSTKEVKKKKKK